MESVDIRIIRSRRKTMSLEVSRDGSVTVRAPQMAATSEIRAFVEKNRDWLRKKLMQIEQETERLSEEDFLTEEDIIELTRRAKEVIPGRVAYFAEIAGVDYGRISIKHQKTRWGSCSAVGNLNFNCLLMLTPPEVIDSVVVHELCHRKHMNHSKDFYGMVRRVFPEYDRWDRWLKKNGRGIMRRMRV